MTLKGKNEIIIKDVLIGEVWLGSGQSNMQMQVNGVKNAKAETAAAKFPKIRMFTVERVTAESPQDECGGSWVVCGPDTVMRFSATAYFFGRELHRKQGVPVGLINASWGGTPIEAWTSTDVQMGVKEIAPLVPYAIRGAIWYQGESNSNGSFAKAYQVQLPLMINDWRKRWNQGEFHFAWVQLPGYKKRSEDPGAASGWAVVREAMLKSLRFQPNGDGTRRSPLCVGGQSRLQSNQRRWPSRIAVPHRQ